jgi:hypothetical protein
VNEEPDVQRLIRELAATGADPAWVAEAVALEQDAARATAAARPLRPRPQLRLVAALPRQALLSR